METVCVLCSEPIEDAMADDVWAEEVGFAHRRSGGGLHALALRRGTNGFAHGACVEKLRS